MDINTVFDRLFDYYCINSLQELALKLGVSQPAISQWKTRNAISAVKKRCRELGIYNEIFGDLTHGDKISVNNNIGQIARNVQGNQTQNLNQKDEYIIPETILDDINILFKLATENEKEDDLINLIDEFIFSTKKELRKK